jgi:hypothetical protein
MTLMIGLHHFFLEMSKKCWPRFRARNSITSFRFFLKLRQIPFEQLASFLISDIFIFLVEVCF